MTSDDSTREGFAGRMTPFGHDGITSLPRLRSGSPLTSILVRLGLLDEVHLLEREVRAWSALERVAEGQLRAAQAFERLRHMGEILAEDNARRKHEFAVAAEQRAHDRKVAPVLRQIDELDKQTALTHAKRRELEAKRQLKEARHPPTPPPPEKPPEPATLATFARQFREALAELEQAPLTDEQKETIRRRMTAAFEMKLGDMSL